MGKPTQVLVRPLWHCRSCFCELLGIAVRGGLRDGCLGVDRYQIDTTKAENCHWILKSLKHFLNK